MTLAQVTYQISTDGEFAASMRSDPLSALAQRGLQLSKEELATLVTVLRKDADELFGLEGLIKRAGWA